MRTHNVKDHPGLSQYRKEVNGPVQAMRVHDIKHSCILHGGRGTGRSKFNRHSRDDINRDPSDDLVKGRKSPKYTSRTQHERDSFRGVPDAVRGVANNLADAEYANGDIGFHGCMDADGLCYLFCASVACWLGGFERRREFGYRVCNCLGVYGCAYGAEEEESCGFGWLRAEKK